MNVYKTINRVSTHLLVWGCPLECESSDVIVCITGSPGIPEFYREFCEKLHRDTGFPVCLIGHAGHDKIPNEDTKSSKRKPHLYGLEEQINHKLDLINNCVNKNCKMHLIGHSIGAYMLVELLNRNEHLLPRVLSVTLLYPTLQRMAETAMGNYVIRFLKKLHIFVIILSIIVQILPNIIVNFIIGIYLKLNSLPSNYLERILLYLNPNIVENALKLAYESMDTVTELNYTALDKIKNISSVIYSTRNHWVPMHHIEDLKRFQPQLRLEEVNVDHAFVLKSSDVVADHVARELKTKIEKG